MKRAELIKLTEYVIALSFRVAHGPAGKAGEDEIRLFNELLDPEEREFPSDPAVHP